MRRPGLYPLATRLSRLSLRLQLDPATAGEADPVCVRVYFFGRTPYERRLLVWGPVASTRREAVFTALALHPLGGCALWPPPHAIPYRRQEH